jgi:hypothetical protein
MNGGTKRERRPAKRRALSRERNGARVSPLLFLPGVGCLVLAGAKWHPSATPDAFGHPFDGRSLGGRGCTTAHGKGAAGDPRGIGSFLEQCTESAPGERVGSTALLAAVNEARRQAGRDPVTARALAEELKRRGIRQLKTSRVFWLDIALKARPPPRASPRRPRRAA